MRERVSLSDIKRIHLVGIGGVGMSALAILLAEKGFTVTGSDIKNGYYLDKVSQFGIKVFLSHHSAHIAGTDAVCYSSAIKPDNPELTAAREQKIPVYKRAQVLGEISRTENVVAVTGSHGKTTTSALLVYLATALGYKPTAFIGAQPLNYEKMAWWGKDFFVIEADESDGSFHSYLPWVSLITNIDSEHLDFYGNLASLREHFLRIARRTKDVTIGCGDDPGVWNILKHVPSIAYGLEEHNIVRAEKQEVLQGETCFDLYIKDRRYPRVRMGLLGEHNVLNVLGAISFFFHIGADIDALIRVLPEFKSTKRRFQPKGCVEGVTFIDDYAHHPTEIKVTLAAARMLRPGRLIALFQPHRYSRLKQLTGEFARCFDDADCLIFTDVYAAGEKRPYDFDELALGRHLKEHFRGPLHYVPRGKLASQVPIFLKPGDMVLSLGAGDINKVSDEIIREFKSTGSRI